MQSKLIGLFIASCALLLPCGAHAGEIFEHTDATSGAQVYVLKQGGTVAKFAPSKGANVFSIDVAGVEYLSVPANMYRFEGWHGVPVLYPTPNRVRNATFEFGGEEYRFDPNMGRHHIHGLVNAEPWRVLSVDTGADFASVRAAIDFEPGTDIYRQFPFRHRLVLTVKVTNGAVRWTYDVDNTRGTVGVPFGFGLHPLFVYQGARDNTFVTIPATHKMAAEDQLPTGELISARDLGYSPGEPISIRERFFDDVFVGRQDGDSALLDFRDTNRAIRFVTSDEFTHTVVWTPDFPILSIENQTSSTDAHNLHAAGFVDEAHLQVCDPGETCSGWVEYQFTASGDMDWIWRDPSFLLTQEHCLSCHGIVFSGARAPNLWDREWQFATSADALEAVIRDGIPDRGMPAFGGLFTDAQIEALGGFMISLLKEYPAEQTKLALDISDAGARQSFLETFTLETVIDGLHTPWSFAFLPGGGIIVNEKPGNVRIFRDGVLSAPVEGTPTVAYRQDAGLLAVALHPDYARNGWVYLAFADPGDAPDTATLKIVRGRTRDDIWVDQQVIWQAPQDLYSSNNSHLGTRLVFDGDYLFFSIGDRGVRDNAQDLASPYGKIHRLHADGSIPSDNPFAAAKGTLNSVWTLGHRNPQGLAFAPDGRLWSCEHGPRGGDELNVIEPGNNYGWPLATHGTEQNGDRISEHTTLPGMTDPALVWQDGIAPSSIAFYRGKQFPHWRQSLLVTSLAAQELRRLEVDGGIVDSQELLLKGVGRIRDVQIGPDGYPYLAVERSSTTGSILRLIPAEAGEISLPGAEENVE